MNIVTQSNSPEGLSNAIYEALVKRIPPKKHSAYLRDIVEVITNELAKGEIYFNIIENSPPESLQCSGWPKEHLKALKESGWIENDLSPIVLEGDCISWRKWNYGMKNAIKELENRSKSGKTLQIKPNKFKDKQINEKLNTEQNEAVNAIETENIILLSGGPGTGKTSTIIQMILKASENKNDPSIGLAAPTGKAVRRLKESLDNTLNVLTPIEQKRLNNIPCRTLHRWLEASPRGFSRNHNTPLNLDVLVVDEMSMVDLSLMKGLLNALPQKCQLILVGDPAQLPPIGSGSIWNELQKEKNRILFKRGAIQLKKVYRNRGQLASISNVLREEGFSNFWKRLIQYPKSESFQIHYCSSGELPSEIKKALFDHLFQLNLLTKDLINKNGLKEIETSPLKQLEKLVVLCPKRRGLWGVEQVHKIFLGESLSEGISKWALGTPVMCCENQPELGLANGDIGLVVGEGESRRLLFELISEKFGLTTKLVHPARLKSIEPALATTIHKAQGSEADNVILLWPDHQDLSNGRLENKDLNDRQTEKLLYTAITRARKKVDLIIRSSKRQ